MKRNRVHLLVGSLLLSSCFTSVRTIVESDMRFEHCYRIDTDTHYRSDDRASCWRDWLQHYSESQRVERINFAEKRLWTLAPPTQTASPIHAGSSKKLHDFTSGVPRDMYTTPSALIPNAMVKSHELTTPAWHLCSLHCEQTVNTCTRNCMGTYVCLQRCEQRVRGCLKSCL